MNSHFLFLLPPNPLCPTPKQPLIHFLSLHWVYFTWLNNKLWSSVLGVFHLLFPFLLIPLLVLVLCSLTKRRKKLKSQGRGRRETERASELCTQMKRPLAVGSQTLPGSQSCRILRESGYIISLLSQHHTLYFCPYKELYIICIICEQHAESFCNKMILLSLMAKLNFRIMNYTVKTIAHYTLPDTSDTSPGSLTSCPLKRGQIVSGFFVSFSVTAIVR